MRPLTSLHGRELGLTSERSLLCGKGFLAGEHGKQFALETPNKVVLFDDFLGDILSDPWNPVEGTDTTGSTQLVAAGGIGGVLELLSGNDDANDVHLTDLSGVTSYLNWQASNGGLAMQTRVKLSAITDTYLFIGFTDVITGEVPINGDVGADTIATVADDAVGFLFDTGFLTAGLRLVGTAATVNATIQNIGTTYVPVADDFATYRIEVTAAGVATFFIGGVQVGVAMTGAITAATNVTPCVYVSRLEDTTPVTASVDYIHVSMNRAADGAAE